MEAASSPSGPPSWLTMIFAVLAQGFCYIVWWLFLFINYNFIKQRYDEAKQVFETKQEAYAKYQDANKTLSTALSQAKGVQIKNEYDVASSLFNQLTTQLVQAEMKVKEDIPILTVVEPVTVPLRKSSPNIQMILLMFIFIGLFFSVAFVLVKDYFILYFINSTGHK